MKTMILWGLVLLNVLLLTAFIGRLSGNDAAVAQARSRPADYVLVPANIADEGASAVVYMLDSTNGVLGGMVFDDARKELNTMAPINLDRVFEVGAGVTTGGRNTGNTGTGTTGTRRGTGTGTGTGAPRTGN
ncbi:MAG: hypothetical protein WBD40_02435 [Tepidisphaeraceae bacterium]